MQRFDDFDACAEALRGWDLEAVPLERGVFVGELGLHQSDALLVTEGRFELKLHQRGQPPAGMRTLVIPGDPGQRIFWRNHEIQGDQIMLFPEGAELDAVSQADFHVFAVSFSEERASRLGEVLEGREYRDLLGDREVLACSSEGAETLRAAARACVRSARAGDAGPGESLLASLVTALGSGRDGRRREQQSTRDLAVRRCLGWIEAEMSRAPSVPELCRSAGVSRRTLEYAFQERFGVSPKAYVLARRLDRVRSELKRGGRSVTEAAADWGFLHMSQFAGLYRRAFGELPSQTLRGVRGAVGAC